MMEEDSDRGKGRYSEQGGEGDIQYAVAGRYSEQGDRELEQGGRELEQGGRKIFRARWQGVSVTVIQCFLSFTRCCYIGLF